MESRRQHPTASLRNAGRRTRETSNRFADDDLRLENKQLRELNRDLELRLALLSHELRTPLQAVFGYTELLDAEIHGGLNESQRHYVQRIRQSHRHLLDLINAILDESQHRTDRLDVYSATSER